ncbi:MAG: 6,7-dimethyl-8-ribityllumazine synthase [Mucilaginibacter sp.]|nr:6,7-dimethyl-8-ribityllumazine synthase [Mucilaginibacter sp.]
MIKGITFVHAASTPAVYDTLHRYFSAVGLEPGRAWQTDVSRGAPLLAPVGSFELLDGIAHLPAEVLIEVTAIDDVHLAAKQWLEQSVAAQDLAGRISNIAPTTWKSFAFTIEPVPGVRFAFWQWQDPLRGKPLAIEGDLSAAGMRFGIVVARWNAVITERLLQGALDGILRSGGNRQDIEIVRVPGAWEVASAARALAETKRYDGIITLGCLIRGETAHYEAIYNEVSRGIGQSQQETGVPHGFGVLTCETLEQALNRAGIKAGNKGFEAAVATIEMVDVHRRIDAGAAAGSEPDRRPA